MAGIFTDSDLSYDSAGQLQNGMNKYLGTTYILNHKTDFEPGRTSDFILKIKFERDLYGMDGRLVATADEASEALALSLRDYTGPQMTIEPISIRTGNGQVNYAGVPIGISIKALQSCLNKLKFNIASAIGADVDISSSVYPPDVKNFG